MTDIQEVLREMRDGQWGLSPQVSAWADAIEAETEGKLFRGMNRVERLETALRHISLASQSSMSSKEECGRIARAALAGKEGV